jgi:hypothetical protein
VEETGEDTGQNREASEGEAEMSTIGENVNK